MSWVFCVCTYLIMNGRAVLWAKKISNGNLLWRLLSFLALFCLWYRISSCPYIIFGSVYLNSRPNPIKKLKKMWWTEMSCFFGVSCSCGVVALHSNHSQWYFGSTKLEEIFLESPWTLGGTQKVLTSSLPWLLVGRPGQIYKKGLFSFPMLAEAKIWTPNGWTNILKKKRQGR